MPAIPKESLIPPGGFHFIERSPDRPDVRIEGEGYADLAGRLLSYRLANKIPPGDPQAEIFAFVCGQWPPFCNSPNIIHPSAPGRSHFSQEVLAWVNRLWRFQAGTGAPLVSDTRALARAKICAGCPKQIEWTRGGCTSCVSTAKRVSNIFRAGRNTPEDGKLKACGVLGQDNATAVWASALPEATDESRARLPGHCWRKKEGI